MSLGWDWFRGGFAIEVENDDAGPHGEMQKESEKDPK